MFPGAEGGPQGFRTEVLFGANLSLSQPMDQMMVPAQDVVAGKYKASRPEADGNGVAPTPSLVDWAPVPGVTRRLNAGAPEDQQMSGGSDGGEDRGRGSTCSSRLSRPHVTLGALAQKMSHGDSYPPLFSPSHDALTLPCLGVQGVGRKVQERGCRTYVRQLRHRHTHLPMAMALTPPFT